MPNRGGANGGYLQRKQNFCFWGDENLDSGTDTSPNNVQSPEPALKPSSDIEWPVKRENNKQHGHCPIKFYPYFPEPSITSIPLSQSFTRGPSPSSGRAFSPNIKDFDSSGQFVPGSKLQHIIPIGPFIALFPLHCCTTCSQQNHQFQQASTSGAEPVTDHHHPVRSINPSPSSDPLQTHNWAQKPLFLHPLPIQTTQREP
ncbi:hypothetical protein BY996DRAFT_6420217 [Phakopsora pachyrhizi]|nr:hypothetical protein BY996DRAFT_6420217 [Phakopsora pachyrhizi]